MKFILTPFLILFIFFSCSNNQEEWPKEDQDYYYQICINDAIRKLDQSQSKKLCSCYLEKVMHRYPNVENFIIGENEFVSIMKKCLE